MNSANLALVFGPTLTRAPDDADPRLLHNDVPAINVLIQVCIERYEYLFGPDSEEEGGLSSPPPPPEAPIELDIVSSPPPVRTEERPKTPDSFLSTPPPNEEEYPDPAQLPAHEPDELKGQYQFPVDDEGEVPDPGFHEEDVPMDTPIIPSRDDKPVYVPIPEPFVEDTPISMAPTDEQSRMPIEVGVPTIPGTKVEPIEEPPKSLTVEEPITAPPIVAPPTVPPPVGSIIPPPDEPTLAPPKESPPTGITPQESSTSINTFLEKALDDITASIDSMKKDVGEEKGEEPVTTVTAVEEDKPSGRDKRRDSRRGLDDDDDESDTDSEG